MIKTWPASIGDPAMAEKIKQSMWPLGRSVEKVDAEIAESYKIIQRHNVNQEETHESAKQIQSEGANTYRGLRLIGLLGSSSVRQLCLMVWENERTTNDTLNRLIESHYLQQAHEEVGFGSGRGNRIVFLTRTGLTWVLQKGHLREEDIAPLLAR
ncbi:MAG: hypothetical protein M5U34_46205 [Chloroflexi bacterium]|nr:hypothetical protein [Chloroflexota bacterium]